MSHITPTRSESPQKRVWDRAAQAQWEREIEARALEAWRQQYFYEREREERRRLWKGFRWGLFFVAVLAGAVLAVLLAIHSF